MSAPPDVAPRVFSSLEEAVSALRAAGLRLSTTRRLVLEALFAAEGPLSAAHLARRLELDESSVYRNLELLERRGFVRHIHLGHSPGLFALAAEEELEYLYCERCCSVSALAPQRLDGLRRLIRKQLAHSVRFTHFALVGLCASCAQEPAASAPAGPSPTDAGAPAAAEAGRAGAERPASRAEQLHSHGGYVHSHPRARGRHRH